MILLSNRTYYEVAQICKNGHLINVHARSHQESNQKACTECGQSTYMTCQDCNEPIRGCKHTDIDKFVMGNSLTGEYKTRLETHCQKESFKIPSYCHNCGQPYPWTAVRLEAARLLIEEDDQLGFDEKRILSSTLSDLIVDTPSTQLAIARFKKITQKALSITGEGLKSILIEICSEAVKKALWPSL